MTGPVDRVVFQDPEAPAEAPPQEAPPQTPDNKTNEETKGDSRPPWLPEKFKSAEDMAKSYSELEKKLSQGKPAEEPPAPSKPEQVDAEKVVAEAGLDMTALEAEIADKGDLSEDSYTKLEQAGISREKVDLYKKGVEATRNEYEQNILKGANSSREEVDKALAWAAANMKPEDIEKFNQAVTKGDAAVGTWAIKGLLSDYRQNKEPNLITGGPTQGSTTDVYESRQQMIKDMRNPDYDSDPAFRAKVQAKALRSNL